MLYIILSLPSLLIQGWFEASGRPTYGNHPGEVKNGGEDLNAPGLMEWLWDVIYWTYGCVLLSALGGDKGWWFWVSLTVPRVYSWLC